MIPAVVSTDYAFMAATALTVGIIIWNHWDDPAVWCTSPEKRHWWI